MTTQEFQSRQAWTLEQKIDHSVGAIEAFITRTGKTPYISFSGGKDSTVLFDLCRRFVDKNMKSVFCNTGNEYPEIVKFVRTVDNITVIRPKMRVRDVIEKYGFPLISKEQSQYIRECRHAKSEKHKNKRLYGVVNKNGRIVGKISDKWQYLLNCQFEVAEKCCDYLKKEPFKRFEKETGLHPVMGTMTDESSVRFQKWLKSGCNSYESNRIASYPLSIWTDKDIWEYIRKVNIPYCELYDKGHTRTGCMFCGFGAHLEKTSRFELLCNQHPKAYKIFMEYKNNGITYREALRRIGVQLPDESRQFKLEFDYENRIIAH